MHINISHMQLVSFKAVLKIIEIDRKYQYENTVNVWSLHDVAKRCMKKFDVSGYRVCKMKSRGLTAELFPDPKVAVIINDWCLTIIFHLS